MVRSTPRIFISLLIFFLLLTACELPMSRGGTNHNSNFTQPSTNSTALPSRAAADICPSHLERITTCLTPQALRAAYGIDSLIEKGFTGKGQTVITIVSFGSPTLKQNIDVFSRTFNLPPVDLQVISPLNLPEYDPSHDKEGWAMETELDVQVIHALAPEAKIIVLQSPVAETQGIVGLPEFRQLEEYVIEHQLGHIVSHSWGASELTLQDAQGQQELQKWNDLLEQGTTKHHITYFSSSGDSGAAEFIDHQRLGNIPAVSFAANSPWITGVGGTTVKRSGPTFDETTWNGSGGGFSRFYEMPSYQKMLPTELHKQFNNRRGVPDVSAAADPNTGLAVYLRGQWMLAGGTSASAPAWAAIAAIANQMAGRPLGFINPLLYKLGTSNASQEYFYDVTKGDNSNSRAGVKGYPAILGWDAATGLGTPRAEKLIPALIAEMK